MNKKGFTLIELLAVIVILAIIALIATPAVLNIIEDSRKGAAEASARNIVSAAKTYYMQSVMKGTSVQDFDLSENTLKYDGDQASKGTIIFENGKASGKMYISGYCVEVDTNGNVSSEKIAEEDCTIENIVEPEELKGEAYALLLDNSSNSADSLPLIFVRSETEIKAGDTYESDHFGTVTVKEAYTGFENTVYNEYHYADVGFYTNVVLKTPWAEYSSWITDVVVEDTVRFSSMAELFSGFGVLAYCDLGKVDTSKVTDMNYMFLYAGMGYENGGGMYNGVFFIGPRQHLVIEGLEKWDTSNVTNMSGLFDSATIGSVSDFTNWDTSNVTNMSSMFQSTYFDGGFNFDISKWDTSKVTDMTIMFNTTFETDFVLDLSKWNVDKVTKWDNFTGGNEENIIVPVKFQ